MNSTKMVNRLINEKSPYLLQHAHNPVDWYPWCDEAFEKAKSEDKPIFLSIGYSTCHWCHVMERESFEDIEFSNILNSNYIAIKVDREERPDIDSLYMTYCQALTGQGGWPLTIIMTPDKKPFFAGTYFPKKSSMGMPGFMDILEKINLIWRDDKKSILESSNSIVEQINEHFLTTHRGTISMDTIDKAYDYFKNSFDSTYGGFGSHPKFPSPHNLMFLLRYYKVKKDQNALKMVTETLINMYKGGIFDHIGFGFSRYSTDSKWLVPHFEKMLYDNALLAIVYLETYQITKIEIFSDVAKKILSYISLNMTSPSGGFYSAEDADSEGVEGKFYVWSQDEISSILGKENGKIFSDLYDISINGNFEGKNIPNLINTDLEMLKKYDIEDMRNALYTYREKRVHPYKDDKILTSWNGLMIVAFSYASKVLNDSKYSLIAAKTVDFIFKNLYKNDRLFARFRENDVKYPGYVDDYAFLIWGLIELYEATFETDYLEKAIKLNDELIEYFWDNEEGGLFLYGKDGEKLIARPKEIYDGAIPSGNSVAALNFLRLARLTGDSKLEEKANQIFTIFGGRVNNNSASHAFLLSALLFNLAKTKEIIFVGSKEDLNEFTATFNENFTPFAVSLLFNKDSEEKLSKLVPFISSHKQIDNKPTIYVCENFACQAPITSKNKFEEIIKND